MSKDPSEIAAELVAAALSSNQLKLTGNTASSQASDIASAFRIVRDAVASRSGTPQDD